MGFNTVKSCLIEPYLEPFGLSLFSLFFVLCSLSDCNELKVLCLCLFVFVCVCVLLCLYGLSLDASMFVKCTRT